MDRIDSQTRQREACDLQLMARKEWHPVRFEELSVAGTESGPTPDSTEGTCSCGGDYTPS